jgi:ADP-ribosylglycohydrolase
MIEAALLGLAAGDTLGAGFEGEDRDAIRSIAGRVVTAPLPGTLYTDDTQQALVLGYHLLQRGGVDVDRLARALAELAGPPSVYRGIGTGFSAFLAHLDEGASPDESAQPSAGNGAAMRVAPIAIAFASDFDKVVTGSVEAGLVTHADPIGVAAGAAVAVAVWAAALGQRGRDLVHSAADAASIAEHLLFTDYFERLSPSDHWHAMSRALWGAVDMVGDDPDEIAAFVGRTVARSSSHGSSDGTEPFAPASVTTAITVASGAPDAVTAVGSLVGLGGDTDTMAAIGGAIWGATGFTAWPWEVPARELLLEVGRRLASGRFDVSGLPDLYEHERALSER